MQTEVLAAHIPALTHALDQQERLPVSLRSSLSTACFAIAALLNLELEADGIDVMRVVREYDFDLNGLPPALDLECLQMAIESLDDLRGRQGTYLPANEILTELLKSNIIKQQDGALEVLEQKNGAVLFYGSEFLLLNGRLIIDTEVGRIHRVLEIEPTQNKAIIEVLDPRYSQDLELRKFPLINGKIIKKVGMTVPNVFSELTYNSRGVLLGLYELRSELYLFQSNQTFDVDLEGKFIKAEFLKESNLPAGVIVTSLYVYLIKDGEMHAKIPIKDYDSVNDINIKPAISEVDGTTQIVFWGSLKSEERIIPFLNYDLVFGLTSNLGDLPEGSLLTLSLSKEPSYYDGRLFFSAFLDDQLAFCVVSLDRSGYPSVNSIFGINDEWVTSFEPLADFARDGHGLVRTEDSIICLHHGTLIPNEQGSPIVMDLECHVLEGSSPCFPRLLASWQGWKFYLEAGNIINLRSATFQTQSLLPIGIHVNEKNELTCLAEKRSTGDLTLLCANELIVLGDFMSVEALVGVHYYPDGRICCLLNGGEGPVALIFKDQGDEVTFQEMIKFDTASITSVGLVGNLDSKNCSINSIVLEDCQFQDVVSIKTSEGAILTFIKTDGGCFLYQPEVEAGALKKIDNHMISQDKNGKVYIVDQSTKVDLGFKFY